MAQKYDVWKGKLEYENGFISRELTLYVSEGNEIEGIDVPGISKYSLSRDGQVRLASYNEYRYESKVPRGTIIVDAYLPWFIQAGGHLQAWWNGACHSCLSNDAMYTYGTSMICNACANERKLAACTYCRKVVDKAIRVEIDYGFVQLLCEDCARNRTQPCSRCKQDVDKKRLRGGYCSHCCSCVGLTPYINHWNYKPSSPMMFRVREQSGNETGILGRDPYLDSLYLGLELEVYTGDVRPAVDAGEVLQAIGTIPLWMYYKHDGSIGGGFELVTFPMTHEFLQSEAFPYLEGYLQRLRKMKCKSFDTARCGFHIHTSKDAYSRIHLYKLMRLVYKYPSLFLLLSQRIGPEVTRYAHYNPAYNFKVAAIQKTADARKYHALNIASPNTIEWRIFRGTLDISGLERDVQVVMAAYEYTLISSLNDVTDEKFVEWVLANQDRFNLLASFIKEKDIRKLMKLKFNMLLDKNLKEQGGKWRELLHFIEGRDGRPLPNAPEPEDDMEEED